MGIRFIRNYSHLLFLFCCIIFLNSCSNKSLLNETEKEWLRKNDSLKVSLYAYFPPYQFVNEENHVDGLFIDYLKLLESKIDYSFKKIEYTNWPKLLNDIKNGDSDMVLEIQKTEYRSTFLNFFPLNFEASFVIVTRKDAFYGESFSFYQDKEVVLPEGYSINEILLSKYPDLNIIPLTNDYECLQQLNEGNYDAFVGPKSVVNYFIKTKGLKNLKVVSEIDASYIPGIGIKKENVMLNTILKKATSSITNKEKQVLFDKWFFNPVKPFYLKPFFWILLFIGISTLLAAILGFNRILKLRVKKRTFQLNIAKQHAEESNAFKTNFVHNISHEIRTPMNAIIGYSELLKTNDLSIQNKKKFTNTIISSAKQLLSIVDDVLEISNLQTTNNKTLDAKPTDIDVIFDNLESLFKLEAKEKHLELIIKKNKTKANSLVLIDASKLIRSLCHLIDNAIKFTNKGSVEISYTIVNKTLIITIKDTGIGIEKKRQSKVFNSFSQSEQVISKKYDGLGLGLTLAKENIDLLGGNILFTSEMNKGTTFTISLPYNPVNKKTNKNIESKNTIEEGTLKKRTILIAEDVIINYRLLEILLRKMKAFQFTILHALNGKEAIEMCQENNEIVLVLMDIRMPLIDGYEATMTIKKLKPNLPIIAQTAYVAPEDKEKAYQSGCDDFLAKPIEEDLLIEKINTYLK